jgi:tetratricopeptide (TPR) repeat protein
MQQSQQNGLITTLFMAVFMVSVLLCYANTFSSPFLFDDYNFIVKNNPKLQIDELSFSKLKEATIESTGKKRPLATISLAINYYFSGTDTTSYHLINIVIHILTGIFLFFLFRITLALTETRKGENTTLVFPTKTHYWVAFIAVLIWLLHPLQTNAVTYIVQRMTSMAALFFILSLLCYVKGRILVSTKASAVRIGTLMGGCAVFGLCAVASKENAATLPIFILLYEWFFFQDLKSINKKYVVIGTIAVVFLFVMISLLFLGANPVHRIMSGYGRWDFTMTERLLTQFRVIAYYLTLIVFPHPGRLTIDYNYPMSFSLFDPPTTLISIMMVGMLLFLSMYAARSHRLFSFAVLWFLGNLVIESSVIPIEIIYEHRLYLPSMMIFLFAVYLAWNRFSSKWAVAAAVLVITTGLGLWTYQRNQVWSSDVGFWEDAAQKAPGYARPLQNLAYSLQQRGEHETAIKYYRKSLKIEEKGAAYYNMGLSYSKMGWHLEAINAFRDAIDKHHRRSKSYAAIGYELTMIGEFGNAVTNYKMAIERDPENQKARKNLKKLVNFLRQCRNPEACVESLSHQYPENPALYFKKGLIYEHRRMITKASAAYEKALSLMLESDRLLYLLTLEHLGTCRLMRGDIDGAMALYRKGAGLAPHDSRFSYEMAALKAYQGKIMDALKWLRQAIDSGFSNQKKLESDTRLQTLRQTHEYQKLKSQIIDSRQQSKLKNPMEKRP